VNEPQGVVHLPVLQVTSLPQASPRTRA